MKRITITLPAWLVLMLVIGISMATGAGIYAWLFQPATVPGVPRDVPMVIKGVAIPADGDDIEIQGMKIRLQGIDAIEARNGCCYLGKPWDCAGAATAALQKKLRRKTVTCRIQGKTTRRRPLAHCFVEGENINEWMVRQGWAYAYRKYSLAYAAAEQSARSARRGIWRGPFLTAEERRRLRRQKPRPACLKNPCIPCEGKNAPG